MVAAGPGSGRFRSALAVLAFVYLAGVWLNAAGAPLEEVVPRPLFYFMQIARLFPNAVDLATEYRAEAYSCDDRRWDELDVRPYFPLRANDKENRFDRAMFFYHHSSLVLKAIDAYLVGANNRSGAAPIGGVMLLSLRLPIPQVGARFERYERRPLAVYPAAVRKIWYRTSLDEVRARCDEELLRREAQNR